MGRKQAGTFSTSNHSIERENLLWSQSKVLSLLHSCARLELSFYPSSNSTSALDCCVGQELSSFPKSMSHSPVEVSVEQLKDTGKPHEDAARVGIGGCEVGGAVPGILTQSAEDRGTQGQCRNSWLGKQGWPRTSSSGGPAFPPTTHHGPPPSPGNHALFHFQAHWH